MGSWAAELRRLEAARRRDEREDRKRQKDLERRLKDRAKLSELEQARLEVEVHESAISELLSVHKEQSPRIEWARYAVALPPPEPLRSGRREFVELLKQSLVSIDSATSGSNPSAEAARLRDDQEHRLVQEEHAKTLAEWMRMRKLAKDVLTGKPDAYWEAITEFSSLGEMDVLGLSIHTIVHSPRLIECHLGVKGSEVIPAEVKSLTASGKLSVKPMPKLRAQEIYKDYVCGCVLRLAREMFALLPAAELLVTASVKGVDARTGKEADLPVLSVVLVRSIMDRLNFGQLDPSGAMENFVRRGDVKVSRKSGELAPIVPLTSEDLVTAQPERMDFSGLLKNIRQLRAEIGAKINAVVPVIAKDQADPLPTV